MKASCVLVLMAASLAAGQRPFFAGSKPIGYPEITTTPDPLGDRFGEIDGTTQRLPIEANGDRDLVDRLSKLPIDKQPFWLINWQALEAHRQKPQTYPQKPNPFAEPPRSSGPVNSNSNGQSVASSNANIDTVNRFGTDNIATQITNSKFETTTKSGGDNMSHSNNFNKTSENVNIHDKVYNSHHYKKV